MQYLDIRTVSLLILRVIVVVLIGTSRLNLYVQLGAAAFRPAEEDGGAVDDQEGERVRGLRKLQLDIVVQLEPALQP